MFTPTKGATSLLRSSQRAELPSNPFSQSITKEGWVTSKVHKGRGNTNFLGCAHTRTELSTNPNRLETSWRVTNRPKEMLLVLLRLTWPPCHSKGSSLTPQSCSHPNPSSKNSRISFWREWGRGMNAVIPFVRRNTKLPTGVGTSNPYWICRKNRSASVWKCVSHG